MLLTAEEARGDDEDASVTARARRTSSTSPRFQGPAGAPPPSTTDATAAPRRRHTLVSRRRPPDRRIEVERVGLDEYRRVSANSGLPRGHARQHARASAASLQLDQSDGDTLLGFK